MRKLAWTTALLFSLAACQNDRGASVAGSDTSAQPAATQQAKLTPEQLGELGAKIRKSPNDAQQLLAQHNLTAESFEAQIREVTENAEASKRYSASYAAAARVTP
ncbi:MAG TPA: hypothetical protein VGF48_20465 [Thermoanaerobaculia bacterium]